MSTYATTDVSFSFETHWRPDVYLSDYYSEVQNDEQATIRFLAEAAKRIGDVPRLLEFGCGPTVHHLFPFAARAGEIHVADYLDSNLDAVRHWVNGRNDAHDWSAFAEYALRCERGRVPSSDEVRDREKLTQRRITSFHLADARRGQPLADGKGDHGYPLVLCCFCPDSITDDLDEWRRCTTNVASLVAPDGWLVLAALRGTTSYRVGGVHFPSAGVTADEIATLLRNTGFSRRETTIETADAGDDSDHGFNSVILAASRRS